MEDLDRAIGANLKSAFLCMQAVMPGMRARRWGRIVNISSIGARIGSGSVSVAYGASKAGLEGLARAEAAQLQFRRTSTPRASSALARRSSFLVAEPLQTLPRNSLSLLLFPGGWGVVAEVDKLRSLLRKQISK